MVTSNKKKQELHKIETHLRGLNPRPYYFKDDFETSDKTPIHELIFREMGNERKATKKRFLPFLLAISCLALFASYCVLATGEKLWIQLILFSFLFANLLLVNFALWNYFGAKRILRVWCIELLFVVLIMCFIL